MDRDTNSENGGGLGALLAILFVGLALLGFFALFGTYREGEQQEVSLQIERPPPTWADDGSAR